MTVQLLLGATRGGSNVFLKKIKYQKFATETYEIANLFWKDFPNLSYKLHLMLFMSVPKLLNLLTMELATYNCPAENESSQAIFSHRFRQFSTFDSAT